MLFLLPALIAAQAPAPPVKTLVERHLQALGPFQKIQSRRVRLKVTGLTPFELPVVTETCRPNLLRKEVNIQGQVQVSAYDGQDAWKTDPFVPGGGKPMTVTPSERADLLEESVFDPLLADAGLPVAYLRTEVLPGGPAHVVKVVTRSGVETLLFLDAKTFLEVKRVQKKAVNGRLVDIETTFGDVRWVQGTPIPHRMEIRIPGMPTPIVIRLDSIELNATMDIRRFKRNG